MAPEFSSVSNPCRAVAALLLALSAWPALSQAQAILEYDVIEPRTFGYVVGDKIRRELHLRIRSGYRLDESSLPKAGRLDRWLELAPPEVRAEQSGDGRDYRLILTYQILNAPRALETVTIPQHNLRLAGEPHAVTTLVPRLRVTVAPVTSDLARVSALSLQEERAPGELRVRAQPTRLAWTGAALAALLLLAAWRRGFSVMTARRNLPFASALRELKRLRTPAGAPADRAAELKVVHEAVNRTAGRAVFAHNLDELLAARPEFAPVRNDLEELFAASDRLFFDGTAADAPAGGQSAALLRLCRRGRRIERRSAAARPEAAR